MVEANVKIIEELQEFVRIVSEEKEIRNLFSTEASDFERTRKLPLSRIAQLIINFPKRNLNIEISEFFEKLVSTDVSCTKSAFSQQRSKLHPSFFYLWNQWLVASFYHFYADKIKHWRGYKLLAVDGSSAYLFDKPEVVNYFGKHCNQFSKTPMARIVQVEDVLNKITVMSDIYPIAISEQEIVYNWVDSYPEDGLLLFDRGFANYTLMWLLLNQEREKHFVIRMRTDRHKEVTAFLRSRKKSIITWLYPSQTVINKLKDNGYLLSKNNGISIRLVKVILPNGEIEVLATNLYDEKLYTIDDFKEIYRLRWAIEGSFFRQKNQQQLEIFSGHRTITILQDYYATVFMGNLQSLIEKQCTTYLALISEKRKYTYVINRNSCWAPMKFNVIKLFLTTTPLHLLITLQKAFERNIEPERPGRSYTRTSKSRRLTGKYQTFTNYKRAI